MCHLTSALYSNWSVSFRFTFQNVVWKFLISHAFYILCLYFFGAQQLNSGFGHHLVEVSTSHTAWRTHPLGLAWTRYQPLTEDTTYTTHNQHKRRTFTSSAGFEPANPASERLQTYTLDRLATGIGHCLHVGPMLTRTLIRPTDFVI